MSNSIFYSWENDLDHKTHKNFIERCIKCALNELENEAMVYMDYDRDTKNRLGSPNIVNTILDKIDKSVLFICDISFVSKTEKKQYPNPNVLLELGYAVSKLGWDRIICLFDTNTGRIEDLPFDIRQNRITAYNPNKKNEKKRIADILSKNIFNLYTEGKLFNPLNDYMKGKIDYALLEILKPLSNAIYGTVSMSEGLANVSNLLKCDTGDIELKLNNKKTPAFLLLNTFETVNKNLANILKDLFSSSYFPREWSYTVLELMDWIRSYSYFISKRKHPYPFEIEKWELEEKYSAIAAEYINPTNPKNSFLILETISKDGIKYVDTKGGKVINKTEYPTNDAKELKTSLIIKSDFLGDFVSYTQKIINIANSWLNITDSTFVLDPDYYFIQ